MSHRDREVQEADALRSDPEDDDYDDRAPAASARKRKAPRASAGATSKKFAKRRRGNPDEDDIVASDDDDEISADDSFSGDSVTVERTETGRPKRAVTKNTATLKESSDEEDVEEEIEAIEDPESEEEDLSRRRRQQRRTSRQSVGELPPVTRPKLVVVLPVYVNPKSNMVEKPRHSSRLKRAAGASEPTRRPPTRRSSRQSEGELVELTGSGRHAQPAIKSATPEPRTVRQTRGAKRIPGASAIIEASQEDSQTSRRQEDPDEDELQQAVAPSDVEDAEVENDPQANDLTNIEYEEGAIVAESQNTAQRGESDGNEDDEDQSPVRPGRLRKTSIPDIVPRETRSSGRLKRKGAQESSDFDPAEVEEQEEEPMSESQSPVKASQRSEGSSTGRRSGRLASRKRKRPHRDISDSDEASEDVDRDELAEEARDLSRKRRKRQPIVYDAPDTRRKRGPVDYRVFKPELLQASDDEQPAKPAPAFRRGRAGGPYRSLLSTVGPFGGAGGPAAVLGGPEGAGAVGGADSDSSDDDLNPKGNRNVGAAVGMTPTTTIPHGLPPQTHNADVNQGAAGTGPAQFGKVKDKKALADADPLGVDPTVSFEGVGGLDNHINQLKEMVALPLLYPEVFQQFKVTPPRGVLFHGPPGTGKTLLARALAASVSSQGQKVTFYMRKGADALSKWVGEAERQLRLLFEEARKNQPSIIFFDEIDGLAPVRSSKQEQIHASIVATLLALMDGMDGRGQVIVIGATNRPDSVDPALRRPGRFDREFYFPLPNKAGRLAILDIHTNDWTPPLPAKFKDQLAELTKGYGGADLRALCTEAALNAVQGTYPQIYKSNEKLVIDPTTIKIQAKDFLISIGRMIPSAERSGSAAGAPLENSVEPLLRDSLQKISTLLDDVLPERPKRTALEEAEYDDRGDEDGFERESRQQDFDRARVFRPRLLIKGSQGMGQQYLGAAVLHKFERFFVQSFGLSTIYNDATRTPEAAVVQLFNEVRRHKPGVIYIPNVNDWYSTVGSSVIRVFSGLLRSLSPNDPILLLGIMELDNPNDKPDERMLRDLFGFSAQNQFQVDRPREFERFEYFGKVISMIERSPAELPDAKERRKRQIPQLEVAPPPKPPAGPSKAELKARKKSDMHCLNNVKILIQPIMDHIKNKYRKFRNPTIEDTRISYLYDEQDPGMLTSDIPEDRQEQPRPFELREDSKGVPGLLETETGKFYYNLEIVTIEKRLSNGYYKRLKDFLADIKRLAKDAKTSGDEEKILKANELVANVEVDIQMLETTYAPLVAQCEEVYARERERQEAVRDTGQHPPQHISGSTSQTTGPILLGQPVPGRAHIPLAPPVARPSQTSPLTNGDSPDSHRTNRDNDRQPGQQDEDVQMSNSQDEQDPTVNVAASQGNQAQRSQKSALTTMAFNSQPGDYHNSASTTTSGQKTSDKSNRSSDRYHNTQSSNGVGKEEHPDFSELQEFSGQSQLPDTQELQHSSSQSQPEQHTMGPPLSRQNTQLDKILNPEPQPQKVLDPATLTSLHNDIVHRSSGCSVEQLEQINAALMDTVWQHRGQWNRTNVTTRVAEAFNAVITDIEKMQTILPNTQSSGRSTGDDLDGGPESPQD